MSTTMVDRRSEDRQSPADPGSSGGRAEKYAENTVYELFIALVTLMSLLVMVALMATPETTPVFGILGVMDLLFCFILIVDFFIKLFRAKSKREFMKTGWMDLLGSMPTFAGFRFVALFRVFRVYRLYSAFRVLRVRKTRYIVRELIRRRAESAFYLTLLTALVLLLLCSTVVALVEPEAPDANIRDAQDAIWWGYVTITTVGYGDRTPVTFIGQLAGMVLMTFGIAIFGVLTSFLASVFAAKPTDPLLAGVGSSVGTGASPVGEAPVGTGAAPPAVAPGSPGEVTLLLERVTAIQAQLADIERALRESSAGR